MAFTYEVVLPSTLSALFLQSFEWALGVAGFETVMKLSSPEAPHIHKYKRGDDYISCSAREELEDRERIIIESEAKDFQIVIFAAAEAAAAEFLTELLDPLSQVDKADLRKRVRRCLSGLEGELLAKRD
jgi:hypothetical protein